MTTVRITFSTLGIKIPYTFFPKVGSPFLSVESDMISPMFTEMFMRGSVVNMISSPDQGCAWGES